MRSRRPIPGGGWGAGRATAVERARGNQSSVWRRSDRSGAVISPHSGAVLRGPSVFHLAGHSHAGSGSQAAWRPSLSHPHGDLSSKSPVCAQSLCLSGSPRFLVHQGEAFVKIALMGLAGLIYRNCTSKQFWRNDFRIRTPHQLCGFQMFFPHSVGCLKRCFHSFWGKRPAVGLLDRTVVLFLIS